MFENLLLVVALIIILYGVYWCYIHNPSINYKELQGKNVILTGASTGIGEQMAYELASGKAKLIITGLEDKLLKTVAAKCMKLGATSVEYIAMDLSTTENCREFVKKCLSIFKDDKIDYLFLNHALIGPYQEWINLKNSNSFDIDKNIKLIEKTMPVNINSHMIIATLLYRQLEKSKGKLIYTSSLAGYGIQPFVTVYSASKHGISAFFENWRLELSMNKSNMSITICKLALVGTRSALETAGPILSDSLVKRAASPKYVAKRIISGGQNRLKFVYAPFGECIAVCVITTISKWVYMKISCQANYGRLW